MESALEDREEIVRYIAQDSLFAAVTVGQRINEQVDQLSKFPDMGRPGRVPETKELVIKRTPYVVAYRVDKDGVAIVRVLHGAQQWPSTI